LIDVAIPSDKNVIQKEAEKKLIEIQRMWNMKCFVIPVIIWGHRNCEQKFTKIYGNNTRATLNRFPYKNCHTRNMTHHKESATS
jgi:hypothetical protein